MNFSAFLSHIDLLPFIYGVLIFAGLAVTMIKLRTGHFLSVIIDIGVFILVFRMHGGTMTGALAATIAALLAGVFFPLVLRRMF